MEPLAISANEISRISAVNEIKIPTIDSTTSCAEMRHIHMDGTTFEAIVISLSVAAEPIAFIHLQNGLLFELLPVSPDLDKDTEIRMSTLAVKNTLEETFNK